VTAGTPGEDQATAETAAVAAESPAAALPPPPPAGDAAAAGPLERPEILVGAAFVGGLIVAFILRRITS
jgi:hypothetical protein